MKKFIGTKEFYKRVFTIIIPIMVQQLFLSLAGYIDSLMINSFGGNPNAYNGVSAANKLLFMCNFVMLGVIAAVSIFTAQFFGAKNEDKVKETVRLSIYSSIIFSIIQFLVIEFIGEFVVNSYIMDPDARQFGYDYLNVMKYGQLFVSLDMCFANAYRSIQKPNIPLYIGIIGIFVNIFFNWAMIFGHIGFEPMGASGAAIATTISKIVEMMLYIISISVFKVSWIKGFLKKLFVSKTLLKDFVIRGTPIVLNEVCWSFGMILMTKFITYHNDEWYNAYAYTQNITDLFFIVFSGLGNGTAILIGSSLGRSDFEQAEKEMNYFRGLGVILGASVGILMISTAPLTCRMFTDNKDTIKLMIGVLAVTSIFTAVYCYNAVCFFTLRAGGDSIRAMIVDQVPTYVLGIPAAIIFGVNASNWGINIVIVYLATHLTDLGKIVVGSIFVHQKKWLVNLTTSKKDTINGKNLIEE